MSNERERTLTNLTISHHQLSLSLQILSALSLRLLLYRFDIRLRGFLSHRDNSLDKTSATDVLKFQKTRSFKYVPLQCVTVIIGPFGDDQKFLISSEGFHHSNMIYIVSLEEVARLREPAPNVVVQIFFTAKSHIKIQKRSSIPSPFAGIGSWRIGLDHGDSSRTKLCGLGLGLGLDDARPWFWLRDLAARR